MRNIAEAYIEIIKDMYRKTTSIRSEARIGDMFKVKVGLYQGSVLSLDIISEKVKIVLPYSMLFVDNIVLYNNAMEGLMESLDI